MDFNNAPMMRELTSARRRAVRGKGVCAYCFNPVFGEMDFPSAKDCKEFFGDQLDEGDGICWWCMEEWVCDFNEYAVRGHA